MGTRFGADDVLSPNIAPIASHFNHTYVSPFSLHLSLLFIFFNISSHFSPGIIGMSILQEKLQKGYIYKAVRTDQDVKDGKDGKDGKDDKESFESASTELPSEAPTESKNGDLEAKEVEAAKHSKDHLQVKLFVVGM